MGTRAVAKRPDDMLRAQMKNGPGGAGNTVAPGPDQDD